MPGEFQRIITHQHPDIKRLPVRYLHTMLRVSNLDESLAFFCDVLGLRELKRMESEQGRFTLVFLVAPGDVAQVGEQGLPAPALELTHNWDPEEYTGGRNFGHVAFEVDDIYAICRRIADRGITINRPPRDGHMAFVRTPDNISIELLQKGEALAPQEPWASAPNTGVW